MVVDIVAGAFMLALGALIIYFTIESSHDDTKFVLALFTGVVLAIAGLWILFAGVTLAMMLKKIFGLVLLVIGFFLLIGFLDIKDYQPPAMGRAGLLIGLFLFILGLWLFIF